MKPVIHLNFTKSEPGQMDINEFKALVMNELLEFVLSQNADVRTSEEEWANRYCEFLNRLP